MKLLYTQIGSIKILEPSLLDI